MKYLLPHLILFLLSFNCFAQLKTFEIKWNTQSSLAEETELDYPTASNMNAELVNGVLEFSYSWKSSNTIDGSVVLNPVYESINEEDLGGLEKAKVGSSLNLRVTTNFARGVSYQVIVFNPIINSKGQLKKIKSFSVKTGLKSTLLSAKKIAKIVAPRNSVLVQGDWFRFAVDTTGVYKITPQFLNSIGMDLNGVDPNTIKIYGNGGKSLPLLNSDNEIFDVPENPIKIVGAEDGVFSGDDYLLFYAEGTRGYIEENLSHINPYSDEVFYYVTAGGAQSKKVVPLVEPSESVDQVFTNYDYKTFHEVDLENIGGLGRIWHGEKFDIVTQRNFNFTIPNVISSEAVNVRVKFSAVYTSFPTLELKFLDGSTELASRSFTYSSPFRDSIAFRDTDLSTVVEGFSGDVLRVEINYDKAGDPGSEGFLDFIQVEAKCRLIDTGKQFGFSNKETLNLTGVGQFLIGDSKSENSVWDVTDLYNISEKVNEGSSEFSVKFTLGEDKKYVSVNSSDLYSPTRASNSRVSNQDLKGSFWNGSAFNDIDYLIITKEAYLPAANRLASFRVKNDGFKAKVASLESIYNEFSTGKQDVSAIRNFIKYIYDNASTPNDRLKFVCLIGDGSYDYKDVTRGNTNDVPLFHSVRSNSFVNSFATDDFYGFMDDNEGANSSSDLLDIAVGRMVAPTFEIAQAMVSKVERFYDKKAFGDWRNKQLYISDDVDQVIDSKLQDTLNNIADRLRQNVSDVNVDKLFSDAFVQEVSSGGERYPKVRRAILDAFEAGVSYVNYFGHGGEDGLSGETIFTADDARDLLNDAQMPIFTTFTCELTRFDNPRRLTAGEFMYWNENGGAVALLTTIRQLTFTTAIALNRSLEDVYSTPSGVSLPIGEAIRLAKVNIGRSTNKRTVACIGDPAIGIPFPDGSVRLTKVNDVNISEFSGALKALDKVKLSGEVVDDSGNKITNYQGEVSVVLFDKDKQGATLGNDGVRNRETNEVIKIDFTELGERVFRGAATVTNGIFDIEFILPRNVQLPIGDGKISFYAKNETKLEDQTGSLAIKIGGLNTAAEEDVKAPEIDIFLNDENFVSGQNVNESPVLLVNFSDESGINTAGGVGHDIIVILDNDDKNPIILNDYYSTDLDDFTKGNLSFRLRGLEPGDHTLKVRASDVYNNAVFEEISFKVSQAADFEINRVLNYPNPFVSYTEFWFSHNSALNDNLQVTVQILTVTGKIVRTINKDLAGETNYTNQIIWDGKDDFGDKIGKGVYVYKISVKSTLTNKTSSKFEKLVIL